MDEKQAYQQKLQARLEEWQANIDKLRAQAKEAQADAQIDYEAQIAELRKRRDEMEKHLEDLRASHAAAWSDVRAGVERAWDDMNKAMQDAWNRVG